MPSTSTSRSSCSRHSGVFGYYPFGMQMQGREFAGGMRYRWGFNGKERESDFNNDNCNFGARIYDGRLGRWLAVYPFATVYPGLSPYASMANCPIRFIDHLGNVIVIPNPDQREAIIRMINSRARGYFGVNSDGVVYLIRKEGAEGYSEYYRDRLVEGINDTKTIEVEISDISTWPYSLSEDGSSLIPPSPDDPDYEVVPLANDGEGVTIGPGDGPQKVIVSGKGNNTHSDISGAKLDQKPDDILMHEFLGHAIPKLLNNYKGVNAIDEENKARIQLKTGRDAIRAPEPEHKACSACPEDEE